MMTPLPIVQFSKMPEEDDDVYRMPTFFKFVTKADRLVIIFPYANCCLLREGNLTSLLADNFELLW